ncbi:VOC family protein [Planctomonas sp. JC2975]|uniref:VOC family protein n=1 Tax=Planctomonas sp. JC2975 TaxID=2729626 RepID=UPI0014759A46|nr:VOC family protein [Planctomonas sp. JC2975]NNC13813.1 VOC family protein [Planctomonas sp. JC2975]
MDSRDARIIAVLTVEDPAAAVDFYRRAFGAVELHRNSYADGRFVAELSIGGAHVRVAPASAGDRSPAALGGTSVRLNLLVEDPDSVAERAVAAGAREVAPIADQDYGLRQGRFADPFGHHWLIGRPLAGGAGDWAIT